MYNPGPRAAAKTATFYLAAILVGLMAVPTFVCGITCFAWSLSWWG